MNRPRASRPYTEEQWAEINALGHRIDGELAQNDVRLTLGGEPTFVSIDNMDGEEWNFTAVGPEKRKLSETLIRRLKNKFTKGGLLHYGQGKWYPGESLPRWALACYWRKDGQDIWHDDSPCFRENHFLRPQRKRSHRFIAELTRVLGVKSKYIIPRP